MYWQVIHSLPVHDSSLLSIHTDIPIEGNITLHLSLEINEEEPVEPFLDIGIDSRRICLIFQNCWQITSNILGFTTISGTIISWDIVEPSPFAKRLNQVGFTKALSLVHHKFGFSSGSTLEILAETCAVETLISLNRT